MGKTDYKVNKDQYTVSTTMDNGTEEKLVVWDIKNVYKEEVTPENLMDVLKVTDSLKRKYPNDETIQNFEAIIRDEICMMFGGTILENLE